MQKPLRSSPSPEQRCLVAALSVFAAAGKPSTIKGLCGGSTGTQNGVYAHLAQDGLSFWTNLETNGVEITPSGAPTTDGIERAFGDFVAGSIDKEKFHRETRWW
jgi:hypothetical protein